MEAHGGYLSLYTDVDVAWLAAVARAALADEGLDANDCGLSVSVLPDSRVMRVAYDAPWTWGAAGARWYKEHQALARRLSAELPVVVHAYAIDPERFELVRTWGGGKPVGGESLDYADTELPDDDSEQAFEKMKQRWPLGHLARVLGVTRETLARLPRSESVLLPLERRLKVGPLWDLLPHVAGPGRPLPRQSAP